LCARGALPASVGGRSTRALDGRCVVPLGSKSTRAFFGLFGAFELTWSLGCVIVGPLGVVFFGGMAVFELISAEGHGGVAALKFMGGAAINLIFTYWGWKTFRSRPMLQAQERHRAFAEALERRERRNV